MNGWWEIDAAHERTVDEAEARADAQERDEQTDALCERIRNGEELPF